MKCAILGYGSIGERHTRLLEKAGYTVAVVTKRNDLKAQKYQSIKDLLKNFSPEYIVISNETSKHYEQLLELENLNYRKKVLVEKPLFHKIEKKKVFSFDICVGYNLRFHPFIQKIKDILKDERKVISAHIYVGQDLSSWRKRNYTDCYSSKKELGGGVLRDLSHELDYLMWFFGPPTSLVAQIEKAGELNINSEDCANILWTSQNCPCVNVSMNYIDKIGRREITIHTNKETIFCDLVNGTLKVNSNVEHLTLEKDFTYQKMHESFISEKGPLCSYKEGYDVLKVIEKAEESMKQKKWLPFHYQEDIINSTSP
ncbi:Gfo/Idh/MocA family oxidoreductase [Bacteriovoracales bacterium]|nr:Gfo/Idh/MocA family oxidoreductase [Bacteriovoracales bacterium]